MTEADKLELELMEKAQQLAALRSSEADEEVPDYVFETLIRTLKVGHIFDI